MQYNMIKLKSVSTHIVNMHSTVRYYDIWSWYDMSIITRTGSYFLFNV